MLTFFRRIRKGLLGTGATRKYLLYAIGEIALVVIGILIALGINALYDKSIKSQTEKEYIQLLISDLKETQNQFDKIKDKNAVPITSTINLLAAFSDPEMQMKDSVIYWLGSARIIDNPVPVLGTAQALVTTGDLRLIRSSNIRTEITQWLSNVEDYWLTPLYQLENHHRITYNKLVAEVDQIKLYNPVSTVADSVYPFVPTTISPFPFNADTFFVKQQSYSLLSDLYHLKLIMANYRFAMQLEAEELEQILSDSIEQ